MSSPNCCFLTCIQISQEASQVVWYAHLFQNFPQFVVIHTVKGFGIVNKAEIGVFLELSCLFDDPMDIGKLISVSSAFSKTSLNTWKFSVHVLLKPGLENFEHYFTSMWDECNCNNDALKILVLPDTSSCAQCTVKSNTLKCGTSEQRKVYCRGHARRWVAPPQNPKLLEGFQQSILKARWRRGVVGCCRPLGVGILCS